jgi:hypothetical protein
VEPLEGLAGRRHQHHLDPQHHLALDEERALEGQRVEGDGDRALDHVLDGGEAEVDHARRGGGQHVGDGGHGHQLVLGQVVLGEEGLLGERPGRAQVADARGGHEAGSYRPPGRRR